MGKDRDSAVTQRSWLIAGAGYTGRRLARRLVASGAAVTALRRTVVDSSTQAGVRTCSADLDDPMAVNGRVESGGVVVYLAPPGDEPGRAEANVIEVARRAGGVRVVYVSSTGVYGSAPGGWVDEDTPTGPLGPRGERRLAAETTLLEAARSAEVDAVVLRVAGIYGPGRGVVARMRAGTYRIVGDGDRFVSRIHVDDLCSIIVAAALKPTIPRRIYTVADDEPATSRAYADAVAEVLGAPLPPTVPLSAVPASVASMFAGDRRISNRRLKADLGVELAYPSWRVALAELEPG